jgi:carotenoid cleavage dioxygenase
MAVDLDQIKAGGLHFSWDSMLPSYFGVMRRGGDGRDMRWFPGPQTMCTHVMGAWSDNGKILVDMDGADSNQFPFFPHKYEPWSPQRAIGQIRRFSVDLSDASANSFSMEVLYPHVAGVALARQDDRYHTRPYRYGFVLGGGLLGGAGPSRWMMIDHKTGNISAFEPGPDAALSEMCFAPRSKNAPEGDGYLIGIVTRLNEHGRSDLVLVDAMNLEAGPIAIV